MVPDFNDRRQHIRPHLQFRYVLRRVLLRAMRRHGLIPATAASWGRIPGPTFFTILDPRRIYDVSREPKRGYQRGTLLRLHSVPWVGRLTQLVLEYGLATDNSRVLPPATGRARKSASLRGQGTKRR